MSVVFAVLCALVWGTADYLGGKASRRAESSVVTLFGQGAGLLAALLVIPIVGDRVPPPADWGYG
ncbi:MAG: EamA family transporter, partial [Actinobacteria bacterium]|nr:EamA family transporter [Actinomycetota bacterium]